MNFGSGQHLSGALLQGVEPKPHADAVTVSYDGIDPTAISLAWTRSTDVDNYNYTIEQGFSSNGPWTERSIISNTDTTSESLTGSRRQPTIFK